MAKQKMSTSLRKVKDLTGLGEAEASSMEHGKPGLRTPSILPLQFSVSPATTPSPPVLSSCHNKPLSVPLCLRSGCSCCLDLPAERLITLQDEDSNPTHPLWEGLPENGALHHFPPHYPRCGLLLLSPTQHFVYCSTITLQ